MFCIDICNKQPLGEELHSVEICFVTSLLNRLNSKSLHWINWDLIALVLCMIAVYV